MADVAVEAAQKGGVAGHEERERPAWLEQRVDGFHCSLVVGDVLEDVDTERRVEAVAAQRVDRVSPEMTANYPARAVVKTVAGCPRIGAGNAGSRTRVAWNFRIGGSRGPTPDPNVG